MFAQKSTNDTKVMTYDSIISYCENNQELYKKLVLSPVGDQAFKIKSVPEEISTTLFGWLTPEYIKIEQPQVEQLKEQGYEMDAWLRGKLLTFNYKSTDETGWKKFREGAL